MTQADTTRTRTAHRAHKRCARRSRERASAETRGRSGAVPGSSDQTRPLLPSTTPRTLHAQDLTQDPLHTCLEYNLLTSHQSSSIRLQNNSRASELQLKPRQPREQATSALALLRIGRWIGHRTATRHARFQAHDTIGVLVLCDEDLGQVDIKLFHRA